MNALKFVINGIFKKENKDMNKQAVITEGYHYARNRHKPVNMFNLNKKLYDSIIESRTKYLKKAMDLTQEEAEYKTKHVYPIQRRFIEEVLLHVAKTKLKCKLVKHPLYFRTDKQDIAWGDKVYPKDIYEIHPDLLKKSTYYPGDTFDLIRGMKVLNDKNKNKVLATALKKLKTLNEYNDADKRTLRKMKRIGDQYIEGQLWVPYDIEGNKIIPKKRRM